MVRILKSQVIEGNISYIEAAGLSDDSKPENVATGSLFLEVDTGDVYAYAETEDDWFLIASLGGGSSGGSSDDGGGLPK